MTSLRDLTNNTRSKSALTPKQRYDRIKHCFDTKPSAEVFVNKFGGRTVAIVGGGPSLGGCLDELRLLVKNSSASIIAINKSHDYLIENGIIPDFCVLLDPREWVKTYVTPHKDVKYLIASQVNNAVWEKLEGYDIYTWHALAHNHGSKVFRNIDPEKFKKFAKGKKYLSIGGGVTAGLRAWTIACYPYMGFSYIHLFGFDSSTDDSSNLYAYQKDSSVVIDKQYFRLRLVDPTTDKELPRTYSTNFNMRSQAANIEQFFGEYAQRVLSGQFPATSFYFHGHGLVPDWGALKGCHVDPDHVDKMRAYIDPHKTVQKEQPIFVSDNLDVNNNMIFLDSKPPFMAIESSHH